MKYLKILGLALFATAIIVSCSEDDNPTDPGSSEAYFKMETGDTWVYENHELDQDQNKVEDTKYYDTTTVVSEESYTDAKSTTKTAYRQRITYSDNSGDDELYFSNENEAVWTLSDFIIPNGGKIESGGISFDVGSLLNIWIKIIDNNKSSWSIMEESDFTIEDAFAPGIDLTFTHSASGKKAEKTTWEGLGKTHDAQKYIISNDIKITSPFTKEINIEAELLFVENIGLVKMEVPAQKITIQLLGSSQDFEFNGSTRVLIDTNKDD